MSSRTANASGANANVSARLARYPSHVSTAAVPNGENLLLLGMVWRIYAGYIVNCTWQCWFRVLAEKEHRIG
jgi:hypothetical protein